MGLNLLKKDGKGFRADIGTSRDKPNREKMVRKWQGRHMDAGKGGRRMGGKSDMDNRVMVGYRSQSREADADKRRVMFRAAATRCDGAALSGRRRVTYIAILSENMVHPAKA